MKSTVRKIKIEENEKEQRGKVVSLDNTIDRLIHKLESESKQLKIRPYQDFQKGVLYYGIKNGIEQYIISSERRLITSKQILNGEIQILCEGFKNSGVSSTVLKRYLKDNIAEIDIMVLYNKISNYLKNLIYLEKKEQFDMLTIWIMGTYIYRMFDAYMYIWANGAAATGKSTLLKAIKMLAFNGDFSSSITAAVMFRSINSNGNTICFDECENLKKDASHNIREIINSGYKKDGKVSRTNMKEGTIEDFEIYSPKVLAGINDIPHELASRCYKIKTINRGEEPEENMIAEEIEEKALEIKDSLYLFGLLNAKKIYNIYKELERGKIEGISNRQKEKWLPILSIAKLIDNQFKTELYNKMRVTAIQETKELKKSKTEKSMEYVLIKGLEEFMELNIKEALKDCGTKYLFDTELVYRHFLDEGYMDDIIEINGSGNKTKSLFSRKLQACLKIKPTVVGHYLKSVKAYELDEKEISERLKTLENKMGEQDNEQE